MARARPALAGGAGPSQSARMTPRPARPDEADALTALCLRSKAHWGYDADFMQQAAPHLAIPTALIADRRVFVTETPSARPAAVMAVAPPDEDGCAELVLLFVDPPRIGKGHGSALLAHAIHVAKGDGAAALRVLSDPNAAPFYRAKGAVQIGTAPSDAIPGRSLPRLEWRLG